MMRVLMVQEFPEIRNVKTARMLGDAGMMVDGAFTVDNAAQRMPGVPSAFRREWRIQQPGELWALMRDYDIVHTHNAPDRLPALALAGRRNGRPAVVWDCHDLVSLLKIPDPRGGDTVLEAFCARQADARIFAAPRFMQHCETRYAFEAHHRATSLIVPNTPAMWMMPQSADEWPEKCHRRDGMVHVVYAGTLSAERGNHRWFYDDFRALLAHSRRVVLHVFPAISPLTTARVTPDGNDDDDDADDAGNGDGEKAGAKSAEASLAIYEELATAGAFAGRMVWHPPVPPQRLIAELARFDVGWLPFRRSSRDAAFLDAFVPNKLYEYRAAGLCVAAFPLAGIRDTMATWHAGALMVETVPELAAILDAWPTDFAASTAEKPAELGACAVAPFESNGPALLDLYATILR